MKKKFAGMICGIVAALTILFYSYCNNFQSEHPQSKLSKNETAEPLTEYSIKSWTDSINNLLPSFEKKQSLIFQKDNTSLSVTAYLDKGEPVLYQENIGQAGESQTCKRYYMKDDNLVLFSEQKKYPSSPDSLHITNMYFRNNVFFYAEHISGTRENNRTQHTTPSINPADQNKVQNIESLENALNQKGSFNVVFQGITEYPKARYIILSKDEVNSYRAVIRVDKDDEFIKELSNNTQKYTGAKLKLDYAISNGAEIVYHSGKIERR